MGTTEIIVVYKGKQHTIKLVNAGNTTRDELQTYIANTVQVPQDKQRLFYRKKRLESILVNTTSCINEMEEYKLDKTIQILLMEGASNVDIEKLASTEESAKREHQVRENRKIVSLSEKNNVLENMELLSSPYRFHDLKTLPNLPNEAHAMTLLRELSTDRGVLAVMKKHKWSVGTLEEMYPSGKVGVDPVCVLGVNHNKGQRIQLRLRTDDLQGFRKILTIKQTLYHELAHNVHSEHDSKFYQLMRQIERECQELDWSRNSSGLTVGGRSIERFQGNYNDNGVSANISQGRMLGMNHESNNGVSRLLQLDTSTSLHTSLADAGNHKSSTYGTDESKQDTDTQSHEDIVDNVMDVEVLTKETEMDIDEKSQPTITITTNDSTMEDDEKTKKDVVMDTDSSQKPILKVLETDEDDLLLNFASDREKIMRRSIKTLVQRQFQHQNTEAVVKACRLLYKIINNLMTHPQEVKFRSLPKTNRVFNTNILCFQECIEFLQAVGFEEQDTTYILTRNDPALLWIGRSTLEEVLTSVQVQ